MYINLFNINFLQQLSEKIISGSIPDDGAFADVPKWWVFHRSLTKFFLDK
jgi:hypothetical protein